MITVPNLNGERRWTHTERTLSKRRVNDVWNAKRKLVNEMWTQNDERTLNANGAQRERIVNSERTMKAQWTFRSESLGYFPCIVLNKLNLFLFICLGFIVPLQNKTL